MASPKNITVSYVVSSFDKSSSHLWDFMRTFQKARFPQMRFIENPHDREAAFVIPLNVGNVLLEELEANPPQDIVVLVHAVDAGGNETLKFSNHVGKVLNFFRTDET